MRTPAAAYDIKEWMWGLGEHAPKGEVRKGDVVNCRPEWRNAHSQHTGQSRRWDRRQGRPQFPRDTSGGSPSSGDRSSNWGSNRSSQNSTVTRVSGESNWPKWPGRGLRVKVNLLTFKDEKTKDAVTYCSWWWDVAIFCHSGWDNQHLLPYVIWSLQGFPGDLARSLGKDTILNDVLQTHWMSIMAWWWHLTPWARSSVPSNKDQGRMWLNLECACCSRSRYSSLSIQEGSKRSS